MTSPDRSVRAVTKHHNRVRAIALHIPYYSCLSTSRLATETGVAKSTISHILHGRSHPLYRTAVIIVKALEKRLGLPLDVREVFSVDGSYPTQFVCSLVGCSRCKPPLAFGTSTDENPDLLALPSGQWTGDTADFDHLTRKGVDEGY